MPINISKQTVIYDDTIFRTGYGYPRGSINGMIRYNEIIMDFEFGVNEEWVALHSIENHPLEGLIRYNEEIKDFEFLIKGEWIHRCDCPRPTPEPPETFPPITYPRPDEPGPGDEDTYSLIVNITPAEVAAIPTVKWVLTGYPGSYDSGHEKQVVAGSYYISGLDAIEHGWITPDGENIQIHPGMPDDTKIVVLHYTRRTFDLQVLLQPPDIHGIATWQLRNISTEKHHGAIIEDLAAGNYVIDFESVGGWQTPESIDAELTYALPDETVVYEATYLHKTYKIHVTFNPSSVRTSAWCSVDGIFGTYYNDQTIHNVPFGTVTVNIADVTGWIRPSETVDIEITDDMIDDTYDLIIDYEGEDYFLRVNILPPMVTDVALWSVVDFTGNHFSGDTKTLPPGTHTVQFSDVANWEKPIDQSVVLGPGLAFNTKEITVSYVSSGMTIRVRFLPTTVQAVAEWDIEGETGIYRHNESSIALDENTYTVRFHEMDHWQTPADVTTSVFPGMVNNERVLNITCVPRSLELQVLIHPGAARPHATWQVNNTGTLYAHEDIVSLPPDLYTIYPKDATGFETPNSKIANLDPVVSTDRTIVEFTYTAIPVVDMTCTNVTHEGSDEIENFSFYIGGNIQFIEIVFECSYRPDRLCIYEGEHPSILGSDIDNHTDPDEYLLYDTGWRTSDMSPGSWAADHIADYPGLQLEPPLLRYRIITTDWTTNIKTLVAYGKDDETIWWISGIRCYATTPPGTLDSPPSYREPGGGDDGVPATAMLKVDRSPSHAPNGTWEMNATTRNYGVNISIATGTYEIIPNDIAGWVKPANKFVTINPGDNLVETMEYTNTGPTMEDATGTLLVEKTPTSAAPTTYKLGADTYNYGTPYDLDVNNYLIDPGTHPDWNVISSTGDLAVTVNDGVTSTVMVEYEEVVHDGSLTVTKTPPEAVPTAYTISGTTYNYGDNISLPPGPYTISPNINGGWVLDMPLGDLDITINAGVVETLNVNYKEAPIIGFLVVNKNPPEASPTTFNIGTDTFDYDEFLSVEAGTYTIVPDVSGGWVDVTPDANLTVTIAEDAHVNVIVEYEMESLPEHMNCFFHASDSLLVGGEPDFYPTIGEPDEDSCNIVPPGDYPSLSDAIPNVIDNNGTFDSFAIGLGTHIKFWAGPNFTGDVLLEASGPAVYYSPHMFGVTYYINMNLLERTYPNPALQAAYPPSTRHVAPFELWDWPDGSMKVWCDDEAVPFPTPEPPTPTGRLLVEKTPTTGTNLPTTFVVDDTTYDYDMTTFGTQVTLDVGTYTIEPEVSGGWNVLSTTTELTVTIEEDGTVSVTVEYEMAATPTGSLTVEKTPTSAAPTTYKLGTDTYNYGIQYDLDVGTYTIDPGDDDDWNVLSTPAELEVIINDGDDKTVTVEYESVATGPNPLLEIFTGIPFTFDDSGYFRLDELHDGYVGSLSGDGGVTFLDPTNPDHVEAADNHYKTNASPRRSISDYVRHYYTLDTFMLETAEAWNNYADTTTETGDELAKIQETAQTYDRLANLGRISVQDPNENYANYEAGIPDFYKRLYAFLLSVYPNVDIPQMSTWQTFKTYCDNTANMISHLSTQERFDIFMTYKWKTICTMLSNAEFGTLFNGSANSDEIINKMGELVDINSHMCQRYLFAEIKDDPDIGGSAFGFSKFGQTNLIRMINTEPNGMSFNLEGHAPMIFQGGQFKATNPNDVYSGVQQWAIEYGTADPSKAASAPTKTAEAYHSLAYVAIHEAGHTIDYLKGLLEGERFGFCHSSEWRNIGGWVMSGGDYKLTSLSPKYPSEWTTTDKEMPPTLYGHSLVQEDFAESWTMYIMNPEAMQAWYPKRYAYMSGTVQAWVDSVDKSELKGNPTP